MAKASKPERAEVYRDRRMQLILSKFLSGEINKIDPVYDSKYGYRYPLVEALIGDPIATEEILTRLYDVGILKRQVFDKTIYCPQCNSANEIGRAHV